MCARDHYYACVYMGVGHTTNESGQHFDSQKLSQFFLVLRMGSNLGSLDLESMLYQLSRPVTPSYQVWLHTIFFSVSEDTFH